MSVTCYRFGAFVLDLPSMSMVGRQGTIELRPKSFDVLLYLLEHAGHLVTKDEVMAAVWPDVTVTEDSLTRCISEVRRALSDDGHCIIKTISKRGYRLDLPVTTTSDCAAPHDQADLSVMELEASREVAAVKLAEGLPSAVHSSTGVISDRPSLAARRQGSPLIWGGILVVVLGALSGISWHWSPRMQTSPTGPLQMMSVPTIAILPFTVTENKASNDRSTLGFSDELRAELARASRGYELTIVSTQDLRDLASAADVKEQANSVRYAVHGTTSSEGGSQRAVIRLVESPTGKQLWSDSFVAGREQAESGNQMAVRVARLLAVQVRIAEVARPLPPVPEAGHFVLMGRSLLDSERDQAITLQAQSLYEKALALDFNSITALQGLARTKLNQVQNHWTPYRARFAVLDQAHSVIERIIKVDPRNVSGHYLRGSILRSRGELDQALAAFEHALALNPNYAPAHAEIGRTKIDAGRARESIDHIRTAILLSPTDPVIHAWYFWAGMAAVHIGDHQAAVEWLLRARQANPNFAHTQQLLAVAYFRIGDEKQARTHMNGYLKTSPKFSLKAWRRSMATANHVATRQRNAIADDLVRLGIPEEPNLLARR